jgi:cell division septation protein DedD
MMTSILNLESAAPLQEPPREPVPEDRVIETPGGADDYEIVLGRSQIASWLFVGVIALAVCSSVAYLGGETVGVRKTAPAAAVKPAIQVPAAATSVNSAPLPEASILLPPKDDSALNLKTGNKTAAPLFAEPETGKVYLQIGAVERGMAMLLSEGLRSRGFDSFVAPGPNEKLFRVLIGPVPDPEAFRRAMFAMNALDLAVYARKYQK